MTDRATGKKRTASAKKKGLEPVEWLIAEALRTSANELNLAARGLRELPPSISRLTRLQRLFVWGNQLTAIPEWVGQLSQLRWLFAAANQLTTLPPQIGLLRNLQVLYIGGNPLISLPESLGQLTNLRALCAMRATLTAVPDSLGQLKKLKILDLAHNQLQSLPESLERITGLTYLGLEGNNSLGLRSEVLGPTATTYSLNSDSIRPVFYNARRPANPADILDYYFRLRSGTRPLNEAKLILVGRGGVGKTSVANRLLRNCFDPQEPRTNGIHITMWPLCLHGKEDVRLHIWDFGGQEIMHATHQFFFTERSLYLLVLNGREGGEDADAEYWLKLIESFAPDSPVIVVQNKTNEHPFELDRRGLTIKFPNIRDFVATDCADNTGLAQLRSAIERETDRLEHLRDAFPASWFSIKERLASMKENFVTFEQYRRICADKGESEPSAQDSLALYLHNLGVALNYKDDSRLRDTHVLNPHWVTNGIYKILNAQRLAEQKGVLRVDDVAHILNPKDYPRHMHRFLFDLMRKFELCFPFPNDDGRYLIPELLGKEQPDLGNEFNPHQCLNFQYHYPILPEGLLPRFIVRTHALSQNHPRWRNGAILEFEGNRALVHADVQDKKVFISITGPLRGRRRLLAVIRSDFERIHADISKLQPQAMVPVPGKPDVVVPYRKLTVMEARDIPTLQEVLGDDIIEVDVPRLLDGVELEDHRRRQPGTAVQQPVHLFYSYSHRDETLRNELDTHLKLLHRRNLIAPWHDRNIDAGDDWRQRIDETLERADLILLLISADFIASDYCYDKEMTRALQRHRDGEARVIPIILRDVHWKSAPFADLQALPKNARPVTRWRNKDSAWRNVAEGIERAIHHLRQR